MKHAAVFHDDAFTPAARRPVPAWVFSGALHLVAFVALGLLWSNAPRGPLGEAEGDRPAGIVFAQTAANNAVEYFSEAGADATGADAAAQAPAAPAAAASLPSAAEADALLIPELALPGRSDVSLAEGAAGLLAVPNASGRGRASLPSGDDESALIASEQAMLRERGPKGSPTNVALFGGPNMTGRSFVFVIDRSKSMGGEGLGALSAASRQLVAGLSNLRPEHRFQVIAYHHELQYLNGRSLLPGTPEFKAAAPDFVAKLAAFGGTQHEAALQAALRLEPEVVVLLTDGGDPPLNARQLDALRARGQGRVAIHCVRFGFGPRQESDDFMERLSRQNKGTYLYVDMSKVE